MVLGHSARLLARLDNCVRAIVSTLHRKRHIASAARARVTSCPASETDEQARLIAEIKALRENNHRYQTLARISPVGVFQTDPNGECIYLNQRCTELTGLQLEEAKGSRWAGNVHPDDRDRVLEEWRAAVQSKSIFKSEYRFVHGGKTVWVVGEAVPELDTTGNLRGYVGAIVDITDRKQTERALKQSESRFKMALSAGRIIAWEWEAATNRIIRSENAKEILGIEPTDSDFPSPRFLAIVHPRQRDAIRQVLENALQAGNYFDHECEIVRLDGISIWIATQAEVVRDKNGKVERVVGVTRDITLRKRAQDSLENARRFLEQTLDALPSHVAVLDNTAKIVTVNSAWRRLADQNHFAGKNYGLGESYLDVCQAAAGLKPQDAEQIRSAIHELLQQKRSDFYYEYESRSDRQTRWFVVRIGRFEVDSSFRLFCSHHDVSEIKRAEEALRESEARFRQLADSMPQIVWSARRDGLIDYQNKKFFEQTGVVMTLPFVGNVWAEILHPDDVGRATEKWTESVRTGQPFEMEYRYVDVRSGGHRWHLGRALPVRNERGEIVRWFGTCTDIEDRKQIEQALETARQQLSNHASNLERAVNDRTGQLEQSMKQMESFCYSIAHDLRAPLRAMQGFTTALFEDYQQSFDETGREYALRIMTSAQRMERLIQDLLNYGRLSHIEVSVEVVDVEAAMTEVLQHLAPIVTEKNAVVSINHPLPQVRANKAMVEEILAHLLSNAVKFVAPDTVPMVKVWSELQRGSARIYISDNGIGIEPEYHERIFRVFEKLHGPATAQATGIGLALVRKSLERMGGQVGVESYPGKGSCFWFELPVVS